MPVIPKDVALAVLAFARDMHNGKVARPVELTTIDEELAAAYRNLALFYGTFRVMDMGMVITIMGLMGEKDNAYVRAGHEHAGHTIH